MLVLSVYYYIIEQLFDSFNMSSHGIDQVAGDMLIQEPVIDVIVIMLGDFCRAYISRQKLPKVKVRHHEQYNYSYWGWARRSTCIN